MTPLLLPRLLLPNCRFWSEAQDGNPELLALYLRHYSSRKARGRGRRSVGAGKLCIGPGEKLVLVSPLGDAVFAWRYSVWRRDDQTGVECTIFRNESSNRSSDMIREAETVAWAKWPGLRLFTMVDPSAVASRNPGYCFLAAGWLKCGRTARGLIVLEKLATTPA